MTILNDRTEQKRFGKFAIVGVLGAVVDFGVFNLLATLLKVPAVPASVVSFSLAVINNFILNRRWTFPDSRNAPVVRQLVQFSVVSVIGLLIRTPLFAWLEKQLVPLAAKFVPNLFTPTFVGHNVSLAIAIIVVMGWNFDRQPLLDIQSQASACKQGSILMNSRERLEKCLKGEPVDRPPVALWRHFPIDDLTPHHLARSILLFKTPII